jgi:hypothetical protein
MHETLITVPDGWEAAGGVCDGGWYAATLKRRDCDEGRLEPMGREKSRLIDPSIHDEWIDDCVTGRRRELAVVRAGKAEPTTLCTAQRIGAPACARSAPRPLVAWTRRVPTGWQLCLADDGDVAILREDAAPLAGAAVAWTSAGPRVACVRRGPDGPRVVVHDADGGQLLSCPGIAPRLAGGEGSLLVLVELPSRDAVELELRELQGSDVVRTVRVPNPDDDYAFHADLARDERRGQAVVVCETAGGWAYDELIGKDRRLRLWTLDDDAEAFAPAPGSANGLLPILPEAFADHVGHVTGRGRSTNVPPIQPAVVLLDDGPAVAYRRFRPRGFKSFGWDLQLLRRGPDGLWRRSRLSEQFGPPDTGFAVLPVGEGRLVCAATAFDQECRRTFEHEARGEGVPGAGIPQPARNARLVVWAQEASDDLEAATIPGDRLGRYTVPPAKRNVAPDPASVGETDGMELIWGDIHAHCSYSKCMASMDGTPEEVLRYQRDVLGCRVLCLTDHTHLMSHREYDYLMDTIEAECGEECVPLLGCEPGVAPGHHTNFYARDREIMDRLRCIVGTHTARSTMYDAIRRELPRESVLVLRHFHGERSLPGNVADPATVDTHAPDLEVAMEAMQNRGDSLLNITPNDPNLPAFPANFLNAGRRLGLLGGSDHNGGRGVYRYCLTGLWVPSPTREAVWGALWNRRTIASGNGKIAIWPTCNAATLGESTTAVESVTIRARLSAPRPIRSAFLLRNGEEVDRVEVGETSAEVAFTVPFYCAGHYWFSVSAEADSAYQDAPAIAHATPIFVTLP